MIHPPVAAPVTRSVPRPYCCVVPELTGGDDDRAANPQGGLFSSHLVRVLSNAGQPKFCKWKDWSATGNNALFFFFIIIFRVSLLFFPGWNGCCSAKPSVLKAGRRIKWAGGGWKLWRTERCLSNTATTLYFFINMFQSKRVFCFNQKTFVVNHLFPKNGLRCSEKPWFGLQSQVVRVLCWVPNCGQGWVEH